MESPIASAILSSALVGAIFLRVGRESAMSDHFDPYYTWLGIPPEEQPADHYRLLGVRRFESNSEVLVNAADQRMAYLRTFQAGKRAVHSQRLLNEVSAAQVCLLDPAKKRAYDERLSRESAAKESPAHPAAVVPVARFEPVAQTLPRAQPIQPLVTTPIAPATTFPRPEAPRPAPLFAQPLVTLSASAHPLQPVVKPKLELPASPVVLIAVASAAALVLLVMGGLIWASWPRAKPEIVQDDKSEAGTGRQPTIVAPPERRDVRPPSPPVEIVQPPITLVEVPGSLLPALPPGQTADEVTAAAGSTAGTVPLLDPASVRYVIRFETGPGPMWARFTPDGKQVSIGSLSDSAGGTFATDGSGPGQLKIPSPVFALSTDGSTLAKAQRSAQQSDRVHVDRISANGRSVPLAGGGVLLRGKANALAISEDKRILFAACGATEKLLALNLLRNLEPIPAFRSNLIEVAWLDVRGDALVCLDASGAGEVHSIRGRRILQTFQVPAFPNSPAALLEPTPQKLSLLVFAPEQAVVQQLTGSKTLDRFPLPGLTTSANLLAISAAGDLVVLRDPAGIAIWNIAQNKAVTRIDMSHSLRFCAIHSQPPLLAFEAPDAQLFLCDLARLLAQPRWILPSGPGWNTAYPTSRGSNTLSKSDSPPMPMPADEAAVQAAISTLRAKGVQGVDSPFTNYARIGNASLTAHEIDGLKLFPRLQTLDLAECPCAALVLERLRGLASLNSVHLRRAPVGDQEMEAVATMTGLTNVDLANTKVTGAGLAKLKALPKLTQVFLPDGTAADLLPKMAELVQLEHAIGWPAGMTDADLQYVGRLTNLRSVILSQANLQGEGLAHLKNLRQIRQLSLPQQLPAGAWLYLKDVQFEELHSPQSLGDAQIEFLRHNQRLKDFTAAPQLTSAGLRTLAAFPALEKLSLFACQELTVDGVAALTQFPALKELQPPREFDSSLLPHLARIGTLERLRLGDCTTNGSLDALASHKTLRALELGKEFANDDCAVLARMPALTEVQFHHCAITAGGIGQLRGAARLDRLVFRNVKLGREEVQAISGLKQLKNLGLFATGLSREQIDGFREAIPRISLAWSD